VGGQKICGIAKWGIVGGSLRSLQKRMVPPPWQLVSPHGVVHHVRDERALLQLAKQEDLISRSKNQKNLLRDLVDPGNKHAIDKLPKHRKHWQLLQRVQWLQRVDTGELVPVIGGDGEYFVNEFAAARADTKFFDGLRLNQFLEKGWLWSNSDKAYEYTQKGCTARWRLLADPPAGAYLPSVALPSPFAATAPPTVPPPPTATPPTATPPTDMPPEVRSVASGSSLHSFGDGIRADQQIPRVQQHYQVSSVANGGVGSSASSVAQRWDLASQIAISCSLEVGMRALLTLCVRAAQMAPSVAEASAMGSCTFGGGGAQVGVRNGAHHLSPSHQRAGERERRERDTQCTPT
jgi:hypothetical protein